MNKKIRAALVAGLVAFVVSFSGIDQKTVADTVEKLISVLEGYVSNAEPHSPESE